MKLGDDYVRSCSLNLRDDVALYWNCIDDIHSGYVVLNRISRLLINVMCSCSLDYCK